MHFNFSPIDKNKEEQNRSYRSFHWGQHLDLFLLDMHSYRSRDDLPDIIQNNKTLLGKESCKPRSRQNGLLSQLYGIYKY